MTEKEKQYLEVLMEEMNGKFSLVLEGHAALDEKIERFYEKSEENHRLAMDLIKYSHNELKEDIQAVDKRSEARDKKLGAKIDGMRGELSVKIEDVGRKACLCVDARRQVDGHEDRIRFLERKVA